MGKDEKNKNKSENENSNENETSKTPLATESPAVENSHFANLHAGTHDEMGNPIEKKD